MMRKENFYLILVLCVFLFVSRSTAQTEPKKDSRFYERQAVQAYQKKDFTAFLENMIQAESLRPNHPRLLYYLAAAYSLNGKTSEAVSDLNKLADMKLVYPVENEEDFAALKTAPDFQAVVNKFKANALPSGNGKTAFTVHEKGLVAESVAYEATTKTFYLSSVVGRKILSVDEKGESKIFADQSEGLWSVFGIKIDAKRGLLWATTTAHKQMPGLKEGESGQTGIFAFDLKTGKVVKKCLVKDKTIPHWLGDLAIAPNGDVYATDSVAPVIYVVRQGKTEIETFLEKDDFGSLQGLDFTMDGKSLFVSDYSRGISKINLATKEIKNLAPPENVTLLGIDGIYFDGSNLIGIQNGVEPQRVIRLALSKDTNKIERFEVVESNNPVFDDITLGVMAGKEFYFVANSQWNALGDDGKFAAPEKLKDVSILKIKL